MYGLAEEALVGVQQELEARLKPPQGLQDGLYAAKDSLPVPSDPIRNALDAFAKKALGDIGRHLPPLLSQCGSYMLLSPTLSTHQAWTPKFCAARLACRCIQHILVIDLCSHDGASCTDAVAQGVQDAVHQC